MINERHIDKLAELLVDRIEQANFIFLQDIGKNLKKIKTLSPSKAHQLIQMLKYGTHYEDILFNISQITNMNVEDVEKIFYEFAKKDQQFYKQFYEYRNVPFVPIEENIPLQRQVLSLANLTKNSMRNFTRNSVIGYTLRDRFGKPVFLGLKDTYNRVLDEALLNVGQGVETFDGAMNNILKQLGTSGLKTVEYQSGRVVRLDSAVRMHLQDGLRNLHNENEKIFGSEFGADGVEISVHLMPAPDHADVQGRQFSNEEFDKFQNDIDAKDYKGRLFPADYNGRDRRSISEYNCYHYIFSIVLGISKPQYTDEQLLEIKNNSNNVVNIDGKDYTKYEATQLQRSLERRIREQKDIQILAKNSGNERLIAESQYKITQLTNKYKEVSNTAGLPIKSERLKVSGYQRVKANYDFIKAKKNVAKKETKVKKENDIKSIKEWQDYLGEKNVVVDGNLVTMDTRLINDNLNKLDELIEKYPVLRKDKPLTIQANNRLSRAIARTDGNTIELSKHFKSHDSMYNLEERQAKSGWHSKVKPENYNLYSITHEFGHAIEFRYYREFVKSNNGESLTSFDTKIKNEILDKAMKNSKLDRYEFKKKYFSRYALSCPNMEWFAEAFAQMELGESNPFIDAFRDWIGENIK